MAVYCSSGIMGEQISASRAASISPVPAYCFPACFTSASLGSVTTAASGNGKNRAEDSYQYDILFRRLLASLCFPL